MKKLYVLYNPYSGNGRGYEYAKKLTSIVSDDLTYINITKITDFNSFFKMTNGEDIIICGGDGTLNTFVNNVYNIKYKNNILYYSTGSGNDFYNDIFKGKGEGPHLINDFIKDLPIVTINDKDYVFLNGVGFGIDGYCCEKGEIHKKKSNSPVNYTKFALKGLLYDYKPTNALIEIDGIEYEYKKVWCAPTMKGRCYGGGMLIAPYQNRLNSDKVLTLVVIHGNVKLKVLTAFSTVFSGKHIKFKNNVSMHTGSNIKVTFDRPVSLQIDGESFLNIKEYTVRIK